MADRPEAKWEPGTLDNTRRNIGPIGEDEAKRMMKKLGGEVFAEKSAPIDYSAFPKAKEYSKRAVGRPASSVSNSSSATIPAGGKVGFATKEKKVRLGGSLPELTSKERQLMDRLMMSDDYKIKPNYGFFNFVRKFKKNGNELVRKSFIEYDLQKHVDHMQEFITTVKSIIQISPDTYKSKILTADEDRFKFLKCVGSWTMKDIKARLFDLQDVSEECTVATLIPFIKTIYRDLIKIYYLGEAKISNYFKDIYADLIKYPKFDQKKILLLSKTGITEWFYLYSQVIKGLYPLLMRMSTSKFDYFQDFFLSQTSNILGFLELTKFDLLLPNKKSDKASAAKKEEKTEEEKKEAAEEKKAPVAGKKSDLVEAGIRLLDNLFPEAGFNHLDEMPDMYPYFQPLYQFRDGYNMLSRENPLQVTVTLLRITEDIFQGCRNIVFTEESEDDGSGNSSSEKLSSVLSEWSVYREILFEKYYGDNLKNFVNSEYSQGDFKSSLFGKKLITTMLWQTKFNFLPYFEFEQLLLEKPKNDSQYRPLCIRVSFLLRFLTALSRNIDSAKNEGMVMGIQNPWEKYHFDIPNIVSRRMDVLLGAKRVTDSAATNANLIKYALLIIAVLDWWINTPSSPAYSTNSMNIYRVNPDDGAPAFSAPERNDQNKLFAERVKQTIEKQKQAKAEQ